METLNSILQCTIRSTPNLKRVAGSQLQKFRTFGGSGDVEKPRNPNIN
jgi:hypothetical protein